MLMMMMFGLTTLALAAVKDVRTKEIPAYYIAAAFVCALVSAVVALSDGTDTFTGLLASCAPGAALSALSFASGQSIGAGDGLLMAAIGPVFGLRATVYGVMIAFFFSALASIALLASKKAHRKSRIPFVPFLASAMGVMTIAHVAI